MSRPEILSTALHLGWPKKWSRGGGSQLPRPTVAGGRGVQELPTQTSSEQSVLRETEPNPDFKLPKLASLIIVISTSNLLQISFFIIVSSSSAYAEYLGGDATFSGVVIGIPTVFSGLTLLPLMRIDQGNYKRPLHIACGSAVLGHVLYALAYRANWLYLILIGRIVSGVSFTFFMYAKRYCSDHRIIGIRRRTTLAGWLVVGQAIGFSLGPFLGGVLYRIGFSNSIFNGYTSPAWIMAGVWTIFWVFAAILFEDVPEAPPVAEVELAPVGREPTIQNEDRIEPPGSTQGSKSSDKVVVSTTENSIDTPPMSSENIDSENPTSGLTEASFRMSAPQWGVTATMCWFAMTCFFILGAWESNIPVFTAAAFRFSPFAAGNLIALGGACTFPFLFLNVFVARRYQDRYILALGTFIGSIGLFITLAILNTQTINHVSLFVCWFLVALGFNLATTVTLSLLSKQLPGHWNSRISVAIQCSNYTGRVTGAVWGGSGVKVGMLNYVGMQIAIVGIGAVMFMTLWRSLKAKTG